jgi:hypothetical protein
LVHTAPFNYRYKPIITEKNPPATPKACLYPPICDAQILNIFLLTPFYASLL